MCRWAAAVMLTLIALLAAGCGPGYVTETTRGEGVREWFLEMPWGRVEALMLWPPESGGPYPALLLVHGAPGSGQRFRRDMFRLVRDQLVVMSISLPGFGESTGPEDFAGPRSVEAVLQAVRYLDGRSYVRRGAIAVYGKGQGAAVALLAAERSPLIRLVAVENGVYDLASAFGQMTPSGREHLRRLLGGDPGERPEAYRERSPLFGVARVHGPVLILHAKEEKRYGYVQAEALESALARAQKPHKLVPTENDRGIYQMRHPSLRKEVVPFLREHFPKKKNEEKSWFPFHF